MYNFIVFDTCSRLEVTSCSTVFFGRSRDRGMILKIVAAR